MKETVDLMALGRSMGHRTQTVPFAGAHSVTHFLQPGPALQSATSSQSQIHSGTQVLIRCESSLSNCLWKPPRGQTQKWALLSRRRLSV